MKKVLSSALIAIALAASPASAAVTFDSAGVFARTLGGFGSAPNRPTLATTTTTLPLAPITISDEVSDTDGRSAFESDALATASFIDPSRGTLAFSASTQATTSAGGPRAEARAIANTRYLFTVDQASTFAFTYAIDRTGATPPSAYIRLALLDGNGNTANPLLNQNGFFGTGGLSFLLDPGSYSFDFSNNVTNAFTVVDPGTDGDSINATLNFDVTQSAVPELGTWAMMIVGFGVVGVAMRRKRKVETTVRFA